MIYIQYSTAVARGSGRESYNLYSLRDHTEPSAVTSLQGKDSSSSTAVAQFDASRQEEKVLSPYRDKNARVVPQQRGGGRRAYYATPDLIYDC